MKKLISIFLCFQCITVIQSSQKRQMFIEKAKPTTSISDNALRSSNPIAIEQKKGKTRIDSDERTANLPGSLSDIGSPNTFFLLNEVFGSASPRSISPRIPQ